MWACGSPPTNPDADWPAPIIATIVESFSKPHEHIAVVPWPTTSTAFGTTGPDSPTAAVKVVKDLNRDARLAPVPLAATGDTTIGIEPTKTDLVITSVRPEHTDNGDQVALFASRLLRVGGILAVLTRCDWARGELTDPTGSIVAAGQSADLLYLQHIVALHGPIRDGQITAELDSNAATEHGRAQHRAIVRGLPTPHLRVHSDVLVFAQPQSPVGSREVTQFQDEPMGGMTRSLDSDRWVRGEETRASS